MNDEQIGELRRAFDLFDSKGKGRIQPQEMVRTMEKLKIDRDRPSMYLMVKSMNTQENNSEGLSFD